jgi:hypothetical protein
MIYAEFIYETGTKSLGAYENEEEVLEAAKAHHARATGGDSGGPTGHPAERIKSIELYDTHPAELAEPSPEVIAEELKNLDTSGGVMGVAALVRDLGSPMVNEPGRHDSMYKAKATKSLTEGWE